MNSEPEVIDSIDSIDSTAITVIEPRSLIDYEPSIEEAQLLLKRRKELFKSIIDIKEDIQEIKGKKFKKKSYWRKLAAIYKVSLEHVKEWREEINEELVYFFIYRARAPWGDIVDATGSCSNREKRGEAKSIHDTRAIAETRAKNRAISDLLSFGEVSAEEINQLYGKGYKPKLNYSSPPQDANFNPDEDIPELGESSVLTKALTNKEHPNKVVAEHINTMINRKYKNYIDKKEFEVHLEKMKNNKWKDIEYKELLKLASVIEQKCIAAQNRVLDLKAAQD